MRWLFGGNRRDDEDWEDLMESSTTLMSATVDPQGEGPISLKSPKDTRTRVLVYGSPFAEMMADKAAAEDRHEATSIGGHRLSVSRGSFGLRGGSPLETTSQQAAAARWPPPPPVRDVVVSAPVVLAGGVLSSCRIDKVAEGARADVCTRLAGTIMANVESDISEKWSTRQVTPVRLPGEYSVSTMATGAFHSVCLGAKGGGGGGQVYVWGHSDCLALSSSEWKEAAAGRSKGHISVPTSLAALGGSSVVGAIAACERTSYALVIRKVMTAMDYQPRDFKWATVKSALVEQMPADGVSLAVRLVHRGQLLCREEVGISIEVSGGTGGLELSGRYFHNGEFAESRPVFMRRMAHSAGHEPAWIYFKDGGGERRQWVISTAAPGTEAGFFLVLSGQPLSSPLELCKKEGAPTVASVGLALVGDSIYLRRDDSESHGLDGRYDRMDGLIDGTVGYALSGGSGPGTVLVPNMAKGRWEIRRGATMAAFSTDAFNCALPWCMSQSIGLWYRSSGGVFRVEAVVDGVVSSDGLVGEDTSDGLAIELEGMVRCCLLLHWGLSALGQLLPVPKLLHEFPSDTEIVDIAAGGHFGLAADRTGAVYGWGDGTYGELLSSKGAAVRRLDALVGFKARQVSCGARHALVVDEQGSVVAFGDNTAGQCGLGSREGHRVKRAKVIPVGGACLHGGGTAACGGRHSALVTAEGRLFTWGHGGDGKLIHVKEKYGPRSGMEEEERVEGGDWEEQEEEGGNRRPAGVAIRSGLKAAVHRPRMVYALTHLKVQAVGLGADSTVVVVGDSTALEGVVGSVDGSTPGSASPLSVSRSSNPFRSRLFASFGGFGSSPALVREDSADQSLPLRRRLSDGSGSIDESIGADSFVSAKESL
ncbi:hypothetical protein FOL47_006087 [Perkinsus chesapeaki]|uniref:Uncharacterized protein n=1 Tax=Perkinsus chesapeaki TaxID=330153 RepID=A0A7J6LU56_PERCH|nr:hypothetical protein FOL47_006087 [Perkinsus chesapeaki]